MEARVRVCGGCGRRGGLLFIGRVAWARGHTDIEAGAHTADVAAASICAESGARTTPARHRALTGRAQAAVRESRAAAR